MLISHPPDKPLYKHLRNVANNSKNKVLGKKLNLSIANQKDIAELSYIIGIAHDFGKASSEWQSKVKNNEKPPEHSHISAIFGLLLTEEIFKQEKDVDTDLFKFLSYLIIKQHHSNLIKISDYKEEYTFILRKVYSYIKKEEIDKLYKELLKSYNINLQHVLNKIPDYFNRNILEHLFKDFERIQDKYDYEEQKIELFLLINFLFSILIDSDKKEAADLPEDVCKPDFSLIKNDFVDRYLENCRTTDFLKFNPELEINKIKNKFYNEVTQNKQLTPTNKLYLLTAPTGIGKTFTAFSAALKLKNKLEFNSKIIYCLPYTSIIDQNYDEIEKILKYNLKEEYEKNSSKYLLKHHHLADININVENYKLESFLKEQLLIESWDSANIITTFVQLFHSIIGYKNNFLKKFHNIVNSIIILDEIQNFPLEYRILINRVLKIFAEKFNTYFILMTATQPLIFTKDDSTELVNPDNYFSLNIFDRVECMVNKNTFSLDEFLQFFSKNYNKNTNSYLIVTNTRSSAVEIYNKMKNDDKLKNHKIYSLTNLLVPIHRLERIKNIKRDIDNKEKVIVISTQLIEAGVDLSFEVVYRDFAPIDSIVQVAGRCNRYGELKNKGKMYLVNLKNDKQELSQYIYNSKILSITRDLLVKDVYPSKLFFDLSKNYFEECQFERDSRELLNAIENLNYESVKKFKIIRDDNHITLLLILDEIANTAFNELGNTFNIDDKWKKKEQIDKYKKIISKYSINIYKQDLAENINLTKTFGSEKNNNFFYIEKENIKYLYDIEIGYLKDPKNFSNTIFS